VTKGVGTKSVYVLKVTAAGRVDRRRAVRSSVAYCKTLAEFRQKERYLSLKCAPYMSSMHTLRGHTEIVPGAFYQTTCNVCMVDEWD
jgi:hypothetical protein